MPNWFGSARAVLIAALAVPLLISACESATTPATASADDAVLLGVGGATTRPLDIWTVFAAVGSEPVACEPASAGISIAAKYYEGVGETTRLGRTSLAFHFTDCTLLVRPVPRNIVWRAHAVLTLTGANGDQLQGTFRLTQYRGGAFTIDSLALGGGTGKLEDYTGTATGSGFIDRRTLEGYINAHGTLTRTGI